MSASKKRGEKHTEKRTEVQSTFVPMNGDQLPSDSSPCSAADGYYWVHAYPKKVGSELDDRTAGKWLVRMDCPYVADYWGVIRDATEAGTLGIGSKISTDWAMTADPSGDWRKHVVCVYTRDWRNKADVLRVARRLHEIGAVKKMKLLYKPDVFTRDGRFEGNAAGEVTVYTCGAPYTGLEEDAGQIRAAVALLDP